MFRLAVLVTLFALAVCQFHHHHHPIIGGTHEHPEHGSVEFLYDPESHNLVSITHSTCYLMPLTSDQQTSVHNHGMEHLELQMMAMISGGEDELTQMTTQSHIISSMCHNHKLYMVGGDVVVKPTVASPEQ